MNGAVAVQTTTAKAAPSNSSSLLLQRKCACGGSAGFTGKCTACKKKKFVGKPLQTKLRVNEPGDEYEQEADRVAEQVMRMSDATVNRKTSLFSETPVVQRRVSANSAAGIVTAPSIVHDVLSAPGQQLDAASRAFFEPRFGHDFSRVRVHSGAAAEQSAREVQANAYTVGHNIVFGAGRYAPGTHEGRRLIAHELAHVVQQSGADPIGAGPSNETRDGSPISQSISQGAAGGRADPGRIVAEADQGTELEANIAGDCAITGHPAMVTARPVALARREKKRAKKPNRDLVVYSGGQSGILYVIKNDLPIYRTRAVSGHSDNEWEKGIGPIPRGTYTLHPKKTQAAVASPQGGVCSAAPISTGYQEITSTEPQQCGEPSHYCTVDCSAEYGAGATCYTPQGCWGGRRLKIEGSARVKDPDGGTVTRGGFYIHGGDHSVAMTSGCVKVFDDAVFDQIRSLSDTVPMCVGTACPEWASIPMATADVASDLIDALW